MAEDHEDDGDDDDGHDQQNDGSSHGFSFLTCGNIGSKCPGDGLTSRGWPNLDKRSDMTEPNPDAAASKREQRRQYYQANRSRISEQQRAYYQANRQERLEAVKAYTEANLGKVREYKRRYYKASGAKVRQNVLEGSHGRDIAADWAVMWEAQQGRCYLCERDMDPDDAHVEHWHGCPAHGPKKSCRACRRGLAHQPCNLVVGHGSDDPSLLRLIADNLERANADIAARQAVMPQHITLF